jgi:FkbM family methyltransferase
LVETKPKGFGRLLKIIDALFLSRLPNDEVLIKTLYGFPLSINPRYDKGIEKKLYLTGTYEKGLLNIISQILKPGDVVVDAGANIGLISIFSGILVGPSGLVLAFEPHPETVHILNKNIQINQLTHVKVFPQGLGSKRSKAKIYSNLHINRGAASLVDFQEGAPSFDVEVSVLDEVLASQEVKKVKLLKVDVEGFEMEVLKGSKELLSRSDGPILVVECSNTRQNYHYSMDDLFRFLTNTHGYLIFRFAISKEKISKLLPVNSVDELPHHDNIVALKPQDFEILSKKSRLF